MKVKIANIKGPPGPANNLTVDGFFVNSDQDFALESTGESPNQHISFQIPKAPSVELQKTETHLQWRLQHGLWQDLVPLSELFDTAVEAQAASEDARDQAATSATASGSARDAAVAARQGAETAQGLSETAKQGSVAARDEAIAKLLEASSITFTASAVDGEPGEPASAEVTGAAPDFGLGLVLPRGRDAFEAGLVPPTDTNKLWLDEGTPSLPESGSPFELRGYGMPNGVVSAPTGTYYTDVVGTNGAWRWLKTSGTGNTGWVVMFGNTGWRNVPELLINSWTSTVSHIRRVNNIVTLRLSPSITRGAGSPSDHFLSAMPLGFRHAVSDQAVGAAYQSNQSRFVRGTNATGTTYLEAGSLGAWTVGPLTWQTDDPWPTTLPGTAV